MAAKKPKVVVEIPPKPRKQRKHNMAITPQIAQNILHERYVKGYTQKRIAATYGYAEITIRKFLERTPYDPNAIPKFNPLDVLKRADLSSLERVELLGKDAAQSLELIIAAANCKLRAALETTKDNVVDKAATVELKDLTALFEKIAPYVMEKKDAPLRKNNKSTETPKARAFNMFKQAN